MISVALNGKDDTAVHAEMAYNGCTVMLGTHPDQTTGARPPKELGGTSVRMYIYSDNVDAMVAQAAKFGAEVCEVPSDQYWGERTGSVRDPEGHVWWIATPLAGTKKTDTAAALKSAADKGYAPQQP
jgi:PhnB protein